MNTILERDIERKLKNMVRKYGGRCLKWVSPGESGVPDRIVLLPGGRVIFAEIKRPIGGKLSELQKLWAKRLTDLGFQHWVLWSHEDLELFKEVELDKVAVRQDEEKSCGICKYGHIAEYAAPCGYCEEHSEWVRR
jgi:hypothetical protein